MELMQSVSNTESEQLIFSFQFRMIIHKVLAENREDPVEAEITLDTEDMIINMKYLDSRLYAGLRNGTLLVFCRDQG